MTKDIFKQKYNKDIRRLALKHNLSIEKVVDIYYTQFELVVKSIRDNKEVSLKLRGFGTFVYNKYIAEKLTKQKKEKDEREILHKTTSED